MISAPARALLASARTLEREAAVLRQQARALDIPLMPAIPSSAPRVRRLHTVCLDGRNYSVR